MTYKELWKLCIEKPGCLQTAEQKLADARIKYLLWLNKENEEYRKGKCPGQNPLKPTGRRRRR